MQWGGGGRIRICVRGEGVALLAGGESDSREERVTLHLPSREERVTVGGHGPPHSIVLSRPSPPSRARRHESVNVRLHSRARRETESERERARGRERRGEMRRGIGEDSVCVCLSVCV
jgi:hypothetical protein